MHFKKTAFIDTEYPVLFPARSILYKDFALIAECSDGLRVDTGVTGWSLVFKSKMIATKWLALYEDVPLQVPQRWPSGGI